MDKVEIKRIFWDYIKNKGLKKTQQREIIINEFLSMDKHITAEELYNIIKKQYKQIGYATVHRTLKLLYEGGLINELKIGLSKARYEVKIKGHHDHLICLKCGKFFEVKNDKIEELQKKLAEKYDFLIKTHKLEIYGICKLCRTKGIK